MNYKDVITYLNRDKLYLMDIYNDSNSELEREMIKDHRETLDEAMKIVDELGRLRKKKEKRNEDKGGSRELYRRTTVSK